MEVSQVSQVMGIPSNISNHPFTIIYRWIFMDLLFFQPSSYGNLHSRSRWFIARTLSLCCLRVGGVNRHWTKVTKSARTKPWSAATLGAFYEYHSYKLYHYLSIPMEFHKIPIFPRKCSPPNFSHTWSSAARLAWASTGEPSHMGISWGYVKNTLQSTNSLRSGSHGP